MTDVATSRPPLGPGLMAKYEYELGALGGAGLTRWEMGRGADVRAGLSQSFARGTSRARLRRRRDGAGPRVLVATSRCWPASWTRHASLASRVACRRGCPRRALYSLTMPSVSGCSASSMAWARSSSPDSRGDGPAEGRPPRSPLARRAPARRPWLAAPAKSPAHPGDLRPGQVPRHRLTHVLRLEPGELLLPPPRRTRACAPGTDTSQLGCKATVLGACCPVGTPAVPSGLFSSSSAE